MDNNSIGHLISSLMGLGVSELETKIYLALLDNGQMSPYQIAKKVDISRSSIYNALQHMVNKGMVEEVPEETVMYLAQDPEVLIRKLEGDYKIYPGHGEETTLDFERQNNRYMKTRFRKR